MKKILLPEELIDALRNVSTKIRRKNAAKFCSIIFQKIELENLPINSYINLSQNYLEKVFNGRYNEWLSELKKLNIIEEYFYGLNDNFEKVSFIPSAGKSKRYRINPALLTTNFKSWEIVEKDLSNYENIVSELKSFHFDVDKLIAAVDEIAENKIKSLKIIQPTYTSALLFNVQFQNLSFDKMSLKKALKIANENDMVLIKDKRKYSIDYLESYQARKRNSCEFFLLKNIHALKNSYFYPSRNETNFRLDYNFTNMDKNLLKIILSDNNKSEIDLSNSQFILFSNVILNILNKNIDNIHSDINNSKLNTDKHSNNNSNINTSIHSNTYKDIPTPITYIYVHTFFDNPTLKAVLDRFENMTSYYVHTFSQSDPYYLHTFLKEVKLFSDLCFSGKLYSFINEKLNIEDGKLLMMEIAFSSEKNHTKKKAELKTYFPNIIGFIDRFKKQNGYKNFSISLQQIESVLFIDTILPAVQKSFSCLPKHDSIIINQKDVNEVMAILKNIFEEINFKYQFKIDGQVALSDPQAQINIESTQQLPIKIETLQAQENQEDDKEEIRLLKIKLEELKKPSAKIIPINKAEIGEKKKNYIKSWEGIFSIEAAEKMFDEMTEENQLAV
ncbi:MAG: hypothetical protein M3Z26_00465 [Bacteroidota bacterium]|nr:hypothetical protein [Bacteroidota bacterium]